MLARPRRQLSVVAALLLALAAALAPAAQADATGARVAVMTQNLYLGASLDPIVAAAQTNPGALPAVTAAAVSHVVQNDFPRRAQAIAGEVAAARPDVIAVQELAQFFTGPYNDPAPATTPVLDYLALLQAALAARNLHYALVAAPQQESDQELPAAVSAAPADSRDVRLVVSNAMLARTDRRGLRAGRVRSGRYAHRLTFFGQSVRRNWRAVDVKAGGRTLRVLNTHLESGRAADRIRTAQARELVAGPLRARVPIVAVGDFNSDPGSSTSAAYSVLTSPGRLRDAWPLLHDAAGLTCCRGELLNVADPLNQRLDLVLAGAGVTPQSVAVVGRAPVAGLYPSDHAGVVARLLVR